MQLHAHTGLHLSTQTKRVYTGACLQVGFLHRNCTVDNTSMSLSWLPCFIMLQ